MEWDKDFHIIFWRFPCHAPTLLLNHCSFIHWFKMQFWSYPKLLYAFSLFLYSVHSSIAFCPFVHKNKLQLYNILICGRADSLPLLLDFNHFSGNNQMLLLLFFSYVNLVLAYAVKKRGGCLLGSVNGTCNSWSQVCKFKLYTGCRDNLKIKSKIEKKPNNNPGRSFWYFYCDHINCGKLLSL